MNANGLKNCKHCGTEQVGVTVHTRKDRSLVYRTHCLNCGISTPALESENASKAIWNAGAEPESINPSSGIRVVTAHDSDWVKLIALLLFREGVMKTTIPASVIREFTKVHDGHVVGVEFDDKGAHLEITTPEQAEAKIRG